MVAGMGFTRATKKQARLRLAIDGPSGSGKTFTALVAAFAIAGKDGRVAVIDTERGSASKYADRFPAYDSLELPDFGPQTYTEAIRIAGEAGYDVLIIDSLSHAWEGEGGALDLVDKAAARGRGNSYTAWKDVTPLHRRMVDAMLQSPCHVIATMRSKIEYILEPDAKGHVVPRKVGMAPIQRQGIEYEFDVVADMDLEHKIIVSKTRCPAIDGLVEVKPTARWFAPLRDWLQDGAPATAQEPSPLPPGQQGGLSDSRPAWSAEERRAFTAAVVEGMGVGMAQLKLLLPELGDNARLSDLGAVDDVIALVRERHAQAMSDGAEAA